MTKTVLAALLAALAAGSATTSQAQAPAVADSRVARLLTEAGLSYAVDDEGDYRLSSALDDGRSQVAWVASATAKVGDLEVRDLWSIAYRSTGQVPQEIANGLLQANAAQTLGAWQVQRLGEEYLLVYSAPIDAKTDARTLALALDAVMRTADAMEQALTGKDEF
jgi:hypothetical protein